MTRVQLMERMRSHEVSNPEVVTRGLSDEVIESTLAWYEHERFTLGKKVGKGLLCDSLMKGGVSNFKPPEVKRSDFDSHARWCAQHVPDLGLAIAGGCYDVLRVLLGREPTPAEVRERYAEAVA